MPRHHVFVSYARKDNLPPPAGEAGPPGWITGFATAMRDRYRRLTGRELRLFIDEQAIDDGRDWRRELGAGLREAQLLIALVSPHYLASPHCRWEWEQYVRREHSAARGDDGIVQVHLVEPADMPRADRFDPDSGERAGGARRPRPAPAPARGLRAGAVVARRAGGAGGSAGRDGALRGGEGRAARSRGGPAHAARRDDDRRRRGPHRRAQRHCRRARPGRSGQDGAGAAVRLCLCRPLRQRRHVGAALRGRRAPGPRAAAAGRGRALPAARRRGRPALRAERGGTVGRRPGARGRARATAAGGRAARRAPPRHLARAPGAPHPRQRRGRCRCRCRCRAARPAGAARAADPGQRGPSGSALPHGRRRRSGPPDRRAARRLHAGGRAGRRLPRAEGTARLRRSRSATARSRCARPSPGRSTA